LIEVFWSDEDGGYIAIAPDLPGCSAFGDTPTEAIQEMEDAMASWLQAWVSLGRTLPAPKLCHSRRHDMPAVGFTKFERRLSCGALRCANAPYAS